MAEVDGRPDTDDVHVVELIESGSAIAGAATGAAIGLVGGPAGVVGGAALGAAFGGVLRRVGSEIRHRFLGPREGIRIGAAVAFAGEAIAEALAAGHVPRDDGFFDQRSEGRVIADEILEGVLQKARDAYEERKVRYLGLLYANVAFHPQVSPQQANYLIALAGQLTYRQLVALAIAYEQARSGPVLRQKSFLDDPADPGAFAALGLEGIALITEIFGLYQQGLLTDPTLSWTQVADVNPGLMRPEPTGAVLVEMMGLDTLPSDERQEFLERFPPLPASGSPVKSSL
jgi:hypothetical protein